MQVGLAFRALAFVLNIDRRRDDRAAKRAAKNFLKSRHLHRSWCFAGSRTARSAFGLFARFFALPFVTGAVSVLIAVLAVFSFHKERYRDS